MDETGNDETGNDWMRQVMTDETGNDWRRFAEYKRGAEQSASLAENISLIIINHPVTLTHLILSLFISAVDVTLSLIHI